MTLADLTTWINTNPWYYSFIVVAVAAAVAAAAYWGTNKYSKGKDAKTMAGSGFGVVSVSGMLLYAYASSS